MPHRPAGEATRCTFGRGDRSERAPLALQPRTPAPRPTGEDVRVVEEAIKHRIAEQLAPVFDRTIRRQQRGIAFVAPHDDLQEIFGGRVRELAHPEIVDNEQSA